MLNHNNSNNNNQKHIYNHNNDDVINVSDAIRLCFQGRESATSSFIIISGGVL